MPADLNGITAHKSKAARTSDYKISRLVLISAKATQKDTARLVNARTSALGPHTTRPAKVV
jgi:hypothetical protein